MTTLRSGPAYPPRKLWDILRMPRKYHSLPQ